jgi:serine/threonine protein kinase
MALVPGTRLGAYSITVPLGAGGMGEVYKATDTRLDRMVAIKVLPEHVAANPDSKQRFEREARTLAALSHPHICPVFDVGSQDGIDFLVMEYLDGETLERRLGTGALPLELAMQVAIQVADALAAAHRAGIVHRDLKPGNIMLTKSGARLLDFGLARAGAAAAVAGVPSMLPTTPPNLTAQGTILGTFQYMAPEQLEGQEADARTDIFAFGAVLYELFTGKKAFTGRTQASLFGAILRDEPPPVSTLQPLAPPPLDRIVKKCLAKEPDRRWQSARDLHDELKWTAEAVISTTRPALAASGRAASPVSDAQQNRRVAWLAIALAMVVLTGAAAWIGLRSPAVPLRVSRLTIAPTGSATPSVGGNDRDLAITPDGSRVAGESSSYHSEMVPRTSTGRLPTARVRWSGSREATMGSSLVASRRTDRSSCSMKARLAG